MTVGIAGDTVSSTTIVFTKATRGKNIFSAIRYETDHDGVVVMLQICIRELLGSNLGWDVNYLTVVPAGELRDSPSICPQPFPSRSFQFIDL
jgi:hypothetical protein